MSYVLKKIKPEMFKIADDIQAFTDTLIYIFCGVSDPFLHQTGTFAIIVLFLVHSNSQNKN